MSLSLLVSSAVGLLECLSHLVLHLMRTSLAPVQGCEPTAVVSWRVKANSRQHEYSSNYNYIKKVKDSRLLCR